MSLVRSRWVGRVSGVVGVVLAGAVVLAGCTGGGGGSPTPTDPYWYLPSPPVTAGPGPGLSASPSVAPVAIPPARPKPKKPAAMRYDNKRGAVAAARYFLELYAYTLESKDLKPLREMSELGCKFCAGVISKATTEVKKGYVMRGIDFTVSSTSVKPPTGDHAYYLVVFNVVQHPWATYDTRGALINSRDKNKAFKLWIAIGYSERRWVVGEANT